MGAVLQWRKFNFFDVKTNIDDGYLSEILKDTEIKCTGSGRGIIFFGDAKGFVHMLNRQIKVSSFHAHEECVSIILASENSNLLITTQDNVNGPSELKIWSPERHDSHGNPLCLRTLKPDPRPSHIISKGGYQSVSPLISSISLHPNNALLAVGFSDGSVMLYRGDIRRERGCKSRIIVTFGTGAITNLHIRSSLKTCHLFATTKSSIYCINCSTKDKETSVELDASGCIRGCSALSDSKHGHELLVARKDAIYTYTTDSKASCYVFEGQKLSLSWFRGYLIVVAKEETSSRVSPTVLTVYDPLNKLVTLSTVVERFIGVMGEWGGLFVMVGGPSLWHLSEKDLQSKLEILFKKNQFDIAIKLAKLQCCNPEDVAEILKQYGDWLYEKGNSTAAMDQYIKTIPHLEPSYVIKKFLDAQHIDNLTTYLQALHKSGNATCDHTTLMLNCYTRLRDSEKLDSFIKEGEIDCDIDLGIKVCRGAGYFDHAMTLAAKHNEHHHYISILVEDKKNYLEALGYISTLKFDDAKANILQYGSTLLHHVPDETTKFLVELCTDYKPVDQPLIKEHQMSLNSYLTPEEPVFANPEDLEYMLIGHSEVTITFLEKVMAIRPLSQHLNTTLLAELLHQYSLAPEGQDQNAIEDKILKMLRNGEVKFDKDHALLLCDKHKFFSGKLILWEQAGMFEELLNWHAARGDYASVVDVCHRHGDANQQLWCSALRLITEEKGVSPPEASLINTVLNKIDELELMPPLEVVELVTSSSHVTLGQIRNYLLRVVDSHSSSFESETTSTENHRQETERMRDTIKSITTDTIEFTGTKCNVCSNNLELPSVHFLCRHSFHVHCFESYSENEAECPICFSENKKLRDAIAFQERTTNRHEMLQEQLDNSPECFSVVADFMGRGVFSQYQILSALHPSPNTTKTFDLSSVFNRDMNLNSAASEGRTRVRELKGISDVVPDSESRIRALERSSQGPIGVGGEGRLRLNEAHRQMVITHTSEGRLRQRQSQLQYDVGAAAATSSENPKKSLIRKYPPTSSEKQGVRSSTNSPAQDLVSQYKGSNVDPSLSISSSLSNPSLPQRPPTLKSENPFEEPTGLNPFEDEFETEDSKANPFAESYDERKNPFAEKSPVENKKSSSKNPFEEDEYDPKLNPFEG